MTKKLKCWLISVLTVLFTMFTFFACGEIGMSGANKKNYQLSETKIGIAVGETYNLVVTCENEPYTGAINWISADEQTATVYQGVVKGIRAGETKVKAVIKEDNVTLTVPVTVNPTVTATLGMATAYIGGGDINVTATAAELPVGATATPIKLTDPTGQEVTNLLTTSGAYNVISNGANSSLVEGIYTVTYDLKSIDAQSTTTRTIRVLKAENINDLLVLDPIDGTEKMYGKVLENNIEPGMNLNRNNPGEYVTYTEEDKVGYGGVVDNSTVYRMYAKRTNLNIRHAWFALDLSYTSSALWLNVDDLPDTATIDVWVRTWFKGEGDEEYQPRRLYTGLYMYKMLADERKQLSTTGYSVRDMENGWVKVSYSVSQNRELLNGTKNLAIIGTIAGVYVGSERQQLLGDYYYDVYSVELNLGMGDMLSSYSGEFSGKYYGSWSGVFNKIDVSLEKNGSPVDFVEGQRLSNGLYDVTYELKKDDQVFDTVRKSLCVGAIDMFATTNGITKPAWGGYVSSIKNIAYENIPAEVGYPQDSAYGASNKGVVAVTSDTNQLMPGLNIIDLLAKGEVSDTTIISLYVYTPAAENSANAYNGSWLMISDAGLGLSQGSTGTNYSGGLNYTTKAITLTPNAWNKISFTLLELKTLAQKAGLTTITNLYVYCRYTEKNAPLYFYSMEKEGELEPYGIDLDYSSRNYVSVVSEAYEHETVQVSLKKLPNELALIRVYGSGNKLLHSFGFNGGSFTMPAQDVRIVLEPLDELPDMYQYNKASLKLSGEYSEFGEYTIQIKKDGSLLKEGVDYTLDANMNVTIEKGEYEVIYTFTEYEKSLTSTLYFSESARVYLATGSSLVYANFTGVDYSVVSMKGLTSYGGGDVSKKPEGAKADYDAAVSITPKDYAFIVFVDIR